MKRLAAWILVMVLLLGTKAAYAISDIEWKNISVPIKCEQGKSYLISGEVTSVFGRLTEVRYRIKDKDWKTIQEKSLSMNTGKHYLENSSTKCISFETLPIGKYTLIVNVSAVVFGSSSTRTIINQEFKVVGDVSPNKLTSKDINWPETLKVGDNFGLRGVLTAENGVIGAVYGTIKDKNGNIVLSGTTQPNTKTHDIKEKNSINDQIKFGKLSVGKYTYTLAAVVISNATIPTPSTVTVIEKVFTVSEKKEPDKRQSSSTGNIGQVISDGAQEINNVIIASPVTEYRYRDSYTVTSWTAWGEWQSSQKTISDPNTMQEESKTLHRWWAAKCKNCGTNNPYHGSNSMCHGCGITLYNKQGLWTDVFAFSEDKSGMQTIYGRSSGRYFNGSPYWDEGKQRIAYRYRTANRSTQWGEWSAWSTAKPAEQENRQVETRTVTK